MSAFLRVWLVKYRCSCSAWFPLAQLYFCRKCARLKCPICLSEETDIVFCPNCHEKNTSTEALQRRFRCQVCHECPMCKNLLSVRSQQDQYYLQCTACQWTSRALRGVPDRTGSNDPWPEPENLVEPELNRVAEWMKTEAQWEKIEREMTRRSGAVPSGYDALMGGGGRGEKDTPVKRFSNLGLLHNDRFNLQNAYNQRKKALHRKTEIDIKLEVLAPSADVPELDPDIFSVAPKPEDALGLSQLIAHPVTGPGGQLLPAKVQMICRRALRCLDCETMLYKGEMLPNVVTPKLQSFAFGYFPDIRISRPVQLVPGQPSAFFLTLSNSTLLPMDISLSGQTAEKDDQNCVDTSKFSAHFVLPNRATDAITPSSLAIHPAFPSGADPDEISSGVLFIQQHKAGLCVECLPSPGTSAGHYALLRLKFSPQSMDGNPEQTFTADVRVQLATEEQKPN